MKRAVVPFLLAFAASAAFACPGADKSADAKAGSATTVASALRTATQQGKAEADRKSVKPVEAKKPTS
jgi:hypothetical protein